MNATNDDSGANREEAVAVPAMRILFVDDEEMVLRMLRLAVASMKEQWEVSFAGSGHEALEQMTRRTFDIVISDMRMPGMTGAQLLNEIFRHYPATFRVILTGFVEHDKVMEAVGTAHQFLAKPFELESIKELLHRANQLKQRLHSQKARLLISRIGWVPSVPDIYFKILDALQSPDCPVERIGEIASTDPGLTTKLLQLVNSAFFGFASRVSNANEAVLLLGTGTVRSLALTCRLFTAFKVAPSRDFSVDEVWNHSLRVARAAEHIARLEHSNNAVVEQAFTAGLLHDLGKLILANSLSSEYLALLSRAAREQVPLSEIESQVLETNHAEVGASLLQLWGLPAELIEGVLWHEQPANASLNAFGPVIAVHVANFLDHEANPPARPMAATPLDTDLLDRLNLSSRLAVWREHCLKR